MCITEFLRLDCTTFTVCGNPISHFQAGGFHTLLGVGISIRPEPVSLTSIHDAFSNRARSISVNAICDNTIRYTHGIRMRFKPTQTPINALSKCDEKIAWYARLSVSDRAANAKWKSFVRDAQNLNCFPD